jgi:hypothetical protein
MADTVQQKHGIVQNYIYTGHLGRKVSFSASYSEGLGWISAQISAILSLVLVASLSSCKEILDMALK